MLRILHLTDFHLNKKTLKDWDDFLKEAFSEFLLKTYNNNLDNSQRFTQEEVESLIKKIIIQKRSEHQQKTAQNQDNQSKDIIELSDNIHLINKN